MIRAKRQTLNPERRGTVWRSKPNWPNVAWGMGFVAAILIGPAVALSQPAWRSRSEAQGIDVVVKTASDEPMGATLERFSIQEGAVLKTNADKRQRISLQDIVWITVLGDSESASSPFSKLASRRETTVTLINGDILSGQLLDRVDDKQDDAEAQGESSVLRIETLDLGSVDVSLDWVVRIDSDRATDPAYRDSVQWFDQIESGEDDRILLTNGDVVQGFILGVNRRGMTLETAFGETQVPSRLVVAARFASPSASASTSRTFVRVSFRHSGRLAFDEMDWSGEQMRGATRFGQTVRAEPDRIVHLEVVGGRWNWLSAHTPISAEHTPMLSLAWDYQRDRNVLGGPIAVAGKTYDHGIGVHSRSILTYDLKGLYSRFTTYFGMDDNSGSYADVSVRILVDGTPRFEKQNVVAGELFGPVRLNVEKADRIELVVDFGENGDLQDRFNWVDTALIR